MADKDDAMRKLAQKYSNRRAVNQEGEEEFLKSGSVIMDAVVSNGKGIPMNKFIQISSESGLGKTTVILHICKAALAKGKRVAYLDVEKGVNESQMKGIGIYKYLDESFFLYPISTFEEAEEVMDTVIQDENLAYIVIDSITALIPEKSLEKSVGDIEPGLNARYASAFLTKYKAKISMSENKPTVWFINQMRTKINFRGMTTYGAAGGSAQKFYADIRLNMRESKKMTKTVSTMEGKNSIQYGSENLLWADKNRFNSPFVEAVITVIFGKGVSNILAYQRVLMSKGVCKMAGAGFWTITIPGTEPLKARGTEQLQKVIKENLPLIRQYVDENGGFELMDRSEEDDND